MSAPAAKADPARAPDPPAPPPTDTVARPEQAAQASPMDPIDRLLRYPKLLRLLRLALFIGLLLLFRKLLVLLVFFVAFERSMGTVASLLSRRTGLHKKASIALVALGLLGAVGVAAALGAGRALHAWLALRDTIPDRIAAFRETTLYHQIQDRLDDTGSLVESAQHYAAGAVTWLSTAGHMVLYTLIGFILAVVYLLEREELDHFAAAQDDRSTAGTLLRWSGHLADAVSVTLQFQVVVAAVNAVLTYPVMLLVGIPHATALLFMVFVSGMIPVVGNFVAGGVLMVLAYQAKGWLGLGLFTGLTFVLHKLESYYLNPRLAARHVRLPGFVLIISLLLWEQLVGFAGLFVSFPFLYVANRLRSEFIAEEQGPGREPAPRPTPPV